MLRWPHTIATAVTVFGEAPSAAGVWCGEHLRAERRTRRAREIIWLKSRFLSPLADIDRWLFRTNGAMTKGHLQAPQKTWQREAMFNLFTATQRAAPLKVTLCDRCALTFPPAGSPASKTNAGLLKYTLLYWLQQTREHRITSGFKMALVRTQTCAMACMRPTHRCA